MVQATPLKLQKNCNIFDFYSNSYTCFTNFRIRNFKFKFLIKWLNLQSKCKFQATACRFTFKKVFNTSINLIFDTWHAPGCRLSLLRSSSILRCPWISSNTRVKWNNISTIVWSSWTCCNLPIAACAF